MAIAAIVSAGAALAGGLIAKKGADGQAKAAENASAQAIAEQRRQYEQNRKDLEPWRNMGSGAVNRLGYLMGIGSQTQPTAQGGQVSYGFDPYSALGTGGGSYTNPGAWRFSGGNPRFGGLMDGSIQPEMYPQMTAQGGQETLTPDPTQDPEFGSLMRGFTMEDFEKDPSYDFVLSEGKKALERSASARGMTASGSQMKALTRYGQNYANTRYAEVRNRFREDQTDRYNRLAGLSGAGQVAATNLGQMGSATAANISNNIISGQTGAAAARASGYQALSNGVMQGLNQALGWYQLSRMNKDKNDGWM